MFLKPVSNISLLVSVDPNDQKKTACYDIDVEVEDPLKSQMSSFLLSTANQQEIASLDNKVRSVMSQIADCGLILSVTQFESLLL